MYILYNCVIANYFHFITKYVLFRILYLEISLYIVTTKITLLIRTFWLILHISTLRNIGSFKWDPLRLYLTLEKAISLMMLLCFRLNAECRNSKHPNAFITQFGPFYCVENVLRHNIRFYFKYRRNFTSRSFNPWCFCWEMDCSTSNN